MSDPNIQINLDELLTELTERGVLPKPQSYHTLSGGSSSQVILLDCEEQPYVFKSNAPHILQSEAIFFTSYADIDLFVPLHYVDPAYRFLVYPYISGEVGLRTDKKAFLNTLAREVIDRYQPFAEPDQWGWIDEPLTSWEAVWRSRVEEASEVIGDHLTKTDHELVRTLVKKQSLTPYPAYLLHGDLGVHNFIFQNGQLCRIIDPTPKAGPPIFDLVYAFCSSPNDLHPDVIRTAATHLTTWSSQGEADLRAEVLLGLYSRLATCIRWHPDDLPTYLAAWQQWTREGGY